MVSSAHYSMIFEMFGKERHGLRQCDLNISKILMLCLGLFICYTIFLKM